MFKVFSGCAALALGAALFVSAGSEPVSAQTAPAASGAVLFGQRCQACHSVVAGARPTVGPNLRGVAGRAAASTTFAYSPALKASKIRWTDAELNSFLAAPLRKVPGTRMVIAVPDPAQRAAIIAYLKTNR